MTGEKKDGGAHLRPPYVAMYVPLEKAILIGTADRSTAFARMESFGGDPSAEELEATSEFIVTACNAHDDLEALVVSFMDAVNGASIEDEHTPGEMSAVYHRAEALLAALSSTRKKGGEANG